MLPSSAYVYGARPSRQRTFPSITNSTTLTFDGAIDGLAIHAIAWGSVFLPVSVVVTTNVSARECAEALPTVSVAATARMSTAVRKTGDRLVTIATIGHSASQRVASQTKRPVARSLIQAGASRPLAKVPFRLGKRVRRARDAESTNGVSATHELSYEIERFWAQQFFRGEADSVRPSSGPTAPSPPSVSRAVSEGT